MLERFSGRILSVTRVVAAGMYFLHGTQKLFDFPLPARAPYHLMSLDPGLAGILELVLSPLLFFGLFTRPVAFILSGEMAFAYFMVHAPQSFWPLVNSGDDAVLYCFVFLYLAAAGGGPWSLDALLFSKREAE